jgi:hypothetical protein
MMPYLLCGLILLLGSATVFAQELNSSDRAGAEAAIKSIHSQAIRAHMRFLADSLLEGREPGSRGYNIAARYVATQLEAMGLRPAGLQGTWFQPVPLRKAVNDGSKSSIVLLGNGREHILRDAIDYAFSNDLLHPESQVEASLVFVGFGVTAPEMRYDDYNGIDVRGKIVVQIAGAPEKFPSTVRAYYSDGTGKARNAVARGAIGFITILSPEDQKRNPWAWVVPQIQAGAMTWLDAARVPHDTFPGIRADALLSQSGAEMIFDGAPKKLEEAFTTAKVGQPQAFPLVVRARIHEVTKHTEFESPNVVALLAGSDPALRSQHVVYTAHIDHLGSCPAVEGDAVCHGALDNAGGVASLLEIARAYASLQQPPRRSILFTFVTGEEAGLLGSDYFAHFPTVPLENITSNITLDTPMGLLFAGKDLVAYGSEHSSLARNVELAARQIGYQVSADPIPEETVFIRSDQYSFVRAGVPSVFINGGTDGLDITRKWLVTKYHTPLDSMNQDFDYQSGAKAAGMNFLVGFEVAQEDQSPAWNKGDFFGSKFGKNHNSAVAP